MTKDEEELKVIYSALDDCRRLIAAGKVQRWDVVKWGVAVNVGLATAAAAIPFKGAFNRFGLAVPFSLIPFLLAVLVAFTSWLLVLHYNRRATGARTTATHLVDQMKRKGIDYDSIVGTNVALDYSRGSEYDSQELNLFTVILFVSVLLPLLLAVFRAATN
jgi:hypothetical protein